MNYLSTINWEKVVRYMAHGGMMAASIYIGSHPEYVMYAPVLQYLGQAIDSPR